MAIFKCKMCGGSLEITDGMTVCECEYCGTKQTLPKLDDEKIAKVIDNRDTNNDENSEIAIDDKIFLLSDAEAKTYFSSDDALQTKSTGYAKGRGVFSDSEGNTSWWLRSNGKNEKCAAIIDNTGFVNIGWNNVNIEEAVRPAMWISLE